MLRWLPLLVCGCDGVFDIEHVGADGTDFFTQKTLTPAFSLSAMRIRLVAGTFQGGEADPGMARFDNYEICLGP